MNHVRCTCGRAFAEIGALLRHRAEAHGEWQWLGDGEPAPLRARPCRDCGTPGGAAEAGHARPWRSAGGRCRRCWEQWQHDQRSRKRGA